MTIRPNGKRTEIRNLPYEGPGRGYAVLDAIIGASRKGQVQYVGGVWTVSRPHTNKLVHGLAARYGRVKVIQYGGVEKCVESCWKGKPETSLQCECVCAGRNHGSGSPYKITVGGVGGPGGALSVQANAPHEFYVP